MQFRPCIDIHNGQVKQIVGGSLKDAKSEAVENFVSSQDAAFYANLYKKHNIRGGHIILLNPQTSEYYKEDICQAKLALDAYPMGLMIGGGVNADNASEFINMGASHVIVTSYVFKEGKINYDNLNKLVSAVGKNRLVIDLSCRKKNGQYIIVTDRWQKFTDTVLTPQTLDMFSKYCDEFLIHAVDVEGKASGIDCALAKMLGNWGKLPITYAGGVGSFNDLKLLKEYGLNNIDVTVGSALDLFGGDLPFEKVLELCD